MQRSRLQRSRLSSYNFKPIERGCAPRNFILPLRVTLASKLVVRILISLVVALVVAYPSVGAASFLPEGILVMGPADCCCAGDEDEERVPAAELNASCCCEVENVPAKLSPRPPALLVDTQNFVFVAPAVLVSGFSPFFAGEHQRFVALERARGPPPRTSLLAQQTSRLI